MTDRTIREVLETSLGNRVLAKMAKQRRKASNRAAVRKITSVNDGYFVRPMPESAEQQLEDGPEQLRLDLDEA